MNGIVYPYGSSHLISEKTFIKLLANKVDKIKKSHYGNQIKKLAAQFPNHKLFPYSSKTKVGKEDLIAELLS